MPAIGQRKIQFLTPDNFWACTAPGVQVGTPGAANSYVQRDPFALLQYTTSDVAAYVQAVGKANDTQVQGYTNGVLQAGAFANFTTLGVNQQKALTLPAGAGKLASIEEIASCTGLWTPSGQPSIVTQGIPARTIAMGGDSIGRGFGAVPLALGFWQLLRWSATRFPLGVGMWNWCFSGQSLKDFQGNQAALVAGILARCKGTTERVFVYQWGVNDWFRPGAVVTSPQGLWSGASYGAFLGSTMALVNAADPSIKQIWLTPFPNDGQATPNSNFGETMAQFVAAATPFIPGYATIWNGQTFGAGAARVDGLHFGVPGNATIAANMLPVLQ